MMIKRLTAVFICLCLVFIFVPVFGDEEQGFIVNILEGEDNSYTYSSGRLIFTRDGTYEVSMADDVSTTSDVIKISEGVVAVLKINNLNIELNNDSALSVAAKAVCELELMGDSEFDVSGAVNTYAAVHVPDGASLNIKGEGSLLAISNSGAGIGGGDGENGDAGNITISGGSVDAQSAFGAGIGDGYGGAGSNITISGGIVSVQSHSGAGIGNGADYSGTPQDKSGNITINGGTVTAYSLFGAGIGSGSQTSSNHITIKDGTVVARSEYGAGIGRGVDSADKSGVITIDGGKIIAESFQGAGIGGGSSSSGGVVIINGGEITANSNYGAGIGGGDLFGYSIDQDIGTLVTISNGTIEAKSKSGAGIGGGVFGNGGIVYIAGGSILASSESAEAFGHGWVVPNHPPLDNGILFDRPEGSPVYLTEFTTDLGESTFLEADSIVLSGKAYGYGTKNLRTDEAGKLYFYLPEGLTVAKYNGTNYIAYVQSTETNSFELRPEQKTASGIIVNNIPYLKLLANYDDFGFEIKDNETELAVSTDIFLPIVRAKMYNSVYPEAVKLSVRLADIFSLSFQDEVNEIDKLLAAKLIETAPDPSTLAKAEQLLVLDISLRTIADDIAVQPDNGLVTISMPLPDGYDPNKTMIAHRKSDGTIEFMESTIENGWITFSTGSFSSFILFEMNITVAELMSPLPSDNSDNSQDYQDSTTDSNSSGTEDIGGEEVSPDDSGQANTNNEVKGFPVDSKEIPKTGEFSQTGSWAIIILAAILVASIVRRKITTTSQFDRVFRRR